VISKPRKTKAKKSEILSGSAYKNSLQEKIAEQRHLKRSRRLCKVEGNSKKTIPDEQTYFFRD
jgi:hypothetical protein